MQKLSLNDYEKNKKDIGHIIVFYQYNNLINPNTYLLTLRKDVITLKVTVFRPFR